MRPTSLVRVWLTVPLAAAASAADDPVPGGRPMGGVGAAAGAPTGGAFAEEPVFGGEPTRSSFKSWLRLWRSSYAHGDSLVPPLSEETLPLALRGVRPKVFADEQAGVLPQELGFALMVEGFQAAAGKRAALENGLSLLRSWLGLAGCEPASNGSRAGGCPGAMSLEDGSSSTRVDADAVLGMVYLSEALGHPRDFAELVVRAVVGFAVADLGFPNVYRKLLDGTRLFVPKGGSSWGGLQPDGGPFSDEQAAWCYNPSSFAPGHLRAFRDFAVQHWSPRLDGLLPSGAELADLTNAFKGAIIAGYNILYYSSCESGVVANWVGVKAECPDGRSSCDGVPWAHTPFVGKSGTCSPTGTPFGAFGPEAAQTPWRISLDFVLYPEESTRISMYDRSGNPDSGVQFGSTAYLRRLSNQYRQNSQCDGGQADSCLFRGKVAAFKLAHAFEPGAPSLTCEGVPSQGHDWWASFMSYPTFTAFVAQSEGLSPDQSRAWLDTLASLCVFKKDQQPDGYLCSSSYFELDQELISTMIMSGEARPLKPASEVAQLSLGWANRSHRRPPRSVDAPAADGSSTTTAEEGVAQLDSGGDEAVHGQSAGEARGQEEDSKALDTKSSKDSDEDADPEASVDEEASASGEDDEDASEEDGDDVEEDASEDGSDADEDVLDREEDDSHKWPAASQIDEDEKKYKREAAEAAEDFKKAKHAADKRAEVRAVLDYERAQKALENEEALRKQEQALEEEQSQEVYSEVEDARAEKETQEEDEAEETRATIEFQKAKHKGDKKAEEEALLNFEKARKSLEKEQERQKKEDARHQKQEEALHERQEALAAQIAQQLAVAEQTSRRFPHRDGLSKKDDNKDDADDEEGVWRFPSIGEPGRKGKTQADTTESSFEGFCCLHADSKSNFCGTCHPKAITRPDSWCSVNESNCLSCGKLAHWCTEAAHAGTDSSEDSAVSGVIEDVSLRGLRHAPAPADSSARLGLAGALLAMSAAAAAAALARAPRGCSRRFVGGSSPGYAPADRAAVDMRPTPE